MSCRYRPRLRRRSPLAILGQVGFELLPDVAESISGSGEALRELRLAAAIAAAGRTRPENGVTPLAN
jgi:hypothetical protein